MDPDSPENPEASHGLSADRPDEAPDHAARARAGDEVLGRTLALVRHLRAGCPWDARQTPRSLRPYLLEEAHETADAVLAGDDGELAEELGDLLLNVAFQVILAEERDAFDGPEVVRRLEAKMRDRHPHVYGDAEEAPDWEEMKVRERGTARDDGGGGTVPREEGDGRDVADSCFGGIPGGLEPVSRSLRVQQRAAALGFDWPDASGALDKLSEEIRELRQAASQPGDTGAATSAEGDSSDVPPARDARAGGTVPDPAVEEEVGDLLFAAVNVARLAGVHPSDALARATRKFEARFDELARRARERGLDLEGASLEQMESIWREVKDGEAEASGS